tara:strand:+ start:269072 stop:270043 length:972 start_codon:yes stop_codon:yes gene_type:complete
MDATGCVTYAWPNLQDKIMQRLIITLLLALGLATEGSADRARYIELARRGWGYELRTALPMRAFPAPVHINGRDLAGSSLCVVGERPHPSSLKTLNAFRALIAHTFGKPLTMRHAGRSAEQCGSGRTVILRLYSGFPPNRALTADLAWMNDVHVLGLPKGSYYTATSPAMAQTFFGKRGQGTHIMVKQPALPRPGTLETAFYKSILIEELFQSFTFGMDIMLFDRAAAFESKLQETPVNLHRLSWESRDFMRALVNSNPDGLCFFDVFMLHAVAQAPVDQTVDPEFISFIDRAYDSLLMQTQDTVADPRFADLLAPGCAFLPQ